MRHLGFFDTLTCALITALAQPAIWWIQFLQWVGGPLVRKAERRGGYLVHAPQSQGYNRKDFG